MCGCARGDAFANARRNGPMLCLPKPISPSSAAYRTSHNSSPSAPINFAVARRSRIRPSAWAARSRTNSWRLSRALIARRKRLASAQVTERIERDRPCFLAIDQRQHVRDCRARLFIETGQEITAEPGHLIILRVVDAVDQHRHRVRAEIIDDLLGLRPHQNLGTVQACEKIRQHLRSALLQLVGRSRRIRRSLMARRRSCSMG